MKLNKFILVTKKGNLLDAHLYNDKLEITKRRDTYFKGCFVVEAEIHFEIPETVALDHGDFEK